jgi:uncharacterized protein (DUF433 family)
LQLEEVDDGLVIMPCRGTCPGKVSGAWVFRGTRIPVTALFENLEDGASVDDFVSWFPGVTKEQVTAVLEYTANSLKDDRLAA